MSVIDNLKSMLAEGQDNALIRFGLANAYIQEKNPEEALLHYETALDQDSRYTAAWKMYGQTLELLMQYEAAKRAYQKGLEVAQDKGDYQAAKTMREAIRALRESHDV